MVDHEELKEGLNNLKLESVPLHSTYSDLENRTETLLSNYNDYVRTHDPYLYQKRVLITSTLNSRLIPSQKYFSIGMISSVQLKMKLVGERGREIT